jgi:hypothetical protein
VNSDYMIVGWVSGLNLYIRSTIEGVSTPTNHGQASVAISLQSRWQTVSRGSPRPATVRLQPGPSPGDP